MVLTEMLSMKKTESEIVRYILHSKVTGEPMLAINLNNNTNKFDVTFVDNRFTLTKENIGKKYIERKTLDEGDTL